jgi:glycosyltransferase involved in cell wall biosynthesis
MRQLRKFSWKTLFNKHLLTDFYERKLVLKSFAENALAICISEDAFNYAKSVLPTRIQKVLLYNAIDLQRFTPSIEPKNKLEITTIGSLVDKKGQSLAIESIGMLKQRGIEVQLNVLGDGPNLAHLKTLAVEFNVEENILFHGNQDYPEQFLQKSSIYLHTAIYEPFGLVLIEAMACGLPIVSTDGFGNRALIKEGENGFMIWERDPKLIAEKVQFLVENDEERKRMVEKAYRFAAQFGMEQYVNRLLDIYHGS